MGYELWISPNTGIRRKGTTFKELQFLFIDKITTDFIYEPLYSCKATDNALHVKEILLQREFDIVGVINDKENIIGFANREQLDNGQIQQFTNQIDIKYIISDSTPISKLLGILLNESFAFVLVKNKIAGIVTRADINKPIMRIYIFGIISLFEMHLNFWVNEFWDNLSWHEIIKPERLTEAEKIYDLRKGKNEDLSLLECIQLSDKKVILKSTNDFRELFNYSKSDIEKLIKNVERIRNELAHSQNSIIANLEWIDFVNTISETEEFLTLSEKIVEEKARTPNKGDIAERG